MNNYQQHLCEQISSSHNIPSMAIESWLKIHPTMMIDDQTRALHWIYKYGLDPWCDDIKFDEHDPNRLYFSIDAWYKIMNQHSQYAGLSLREPSTNDLSTPAWMECTIYRHDRILPIIVKEYFSEVATDHISWQKQPYRMLRHRVIQQCARLAFNISIGDTDRSTLNLKHPEKFSAFKKTVTSGGINQLEQILNQESSDQS